MKEEDIRKRKVFNRYLELVKEDAKTIFKNRDSFTKIDCPACFGKDFNFAFKKEDFSYWLCNRCGTLFANPRPTLKQFEEFYTKSRSSEFWVEEFFKPVSEIRREKIFKPRAERIKSVIESKKKKNFKIADIGAGFGLFLEELKKIMPGIETVAIEPSLEMAKICRNKGLDTIQSLVEEIRDKELFDMLVSFELVEHLYNPKEFFTVAYNLLKKDGLFYFTTQNGEGFDIQVLWDKSKTIFPPHHINFFNPHSISLLAESAGFDVIEITTPGNLDWDIVEGIYKNEGVDIERFWRLISTKANERAKIGLQKWIRDNGFSSHMAALLKKR